MIHQNYTAQEITAARQQLSLFVVEQAEKARADLGFGWQADPDAPSNYPDLREAFQQSQRDAVPLLVSSLHNDKVITTPDANLAMRFWHDVHHVRLGLSFNPIDEQELALWHLNVLTEAGFQKYGLVWQMLQADTVGQNYLLGVSGSFPLDQRRFVYYCVKEGLDKGVYREARLIAQQQRAIA
jgi:hypothetical protein